MQNLFPGIRIFIPPAIVLGTDVFDEFMEENDLREFALKAVDDRTILQRFVTAERFPKEVMSELVSFLELYHILGSETLLEIFLLNNGMA